jgi:hypothetical protein
MAESHAYVELIDYLRSEGHSQAEIDTILDRVREYDRQTRQDSIMDSIGNGTFDFAALLKKLSESNLEPSQNL